MKIYLQIFMMMMIIAGCSSFSLLNGKTTKMIQNKITDKFLTDSHPKIELDYQIYLPNNYNNSQNNFPLVLFLHGAGERGNDLKLIETHGIPKLINFGKDFPFITVVPQCPISGYWSDSLYVSTLILLVEKIMSMYKVNSKRVYATGLSMGGYGTLAIAKERPDLFAAILPVCGGMDTTNIYKLGNMPIWLFHGSEDSVVPVENSQKIYDLLKPKNPNIKITIYDGIGHNSWDITYNNKKIYKWLTSHSK